MGIVCLGSGTFAKVFTMPSRGSVALKQVYDPMRASELENEFENLQTLYAKFKEQGLFNLPIPMKHYHNLLTFQTDVGEIFDTSTSPMQTNALYTMQRVWPIPRKLGATIQAKYFPPGFKGDEFIARIYIGERTSFEWPSKFFKSKNFPLYVDRLEELAFPVDLLAHDMGLMLGSINFIAGKDGRGIKFVLGGDAIDTLTNMQFYCIDFNKLQDHHGVVINIVESIIFNYPYYPRPRSPYWLDFVKGYLKAAHNAPHGKVALAYAVINTIKEVTY